MRKAFSVLVIIGFVISGVSLCFAGPQVNDPAPNFTLPDSGGTNHSLSDFTGRVVLLDFWQGSCGWSRAELPYIDSLQDGYDTTLVRVITINLWDSWSTINFVVWEYSFLTLRDGTGSVWNDYKQNDSIPLNYVIERDPQIVHGWMEGYNDGEIRQWIIECLTGVEEKSKSKNQNAKLEASPNPFTQRTVIKIQGLGVGQGFSLANLKVCPTIQIYDLTGILIRTLPIPNPQSPITKIVWDGKDNRGARVPSGVYFCQLTTGKENLIEKLIVTK